MSLIADYAAHEKGIVLSPNAKKQVDEIITEAYRNRDRTFGNARFAYDVLDQTKINMGLRLMTMDNPRELSKDELSLVSAQDVEKIRITNKNGMQIKIT